jgi:hypothetical protein
MEPNLMHMFHLNNILCSIVKINGKTTTEFGQAMQEIHSNLERVCGKLESIVEDSTGADGSGAV